MVFPWAAAAVDTDLPHMVVMGKDVGMNEEAVEVMAEVVEVVEATEQLFYVWQ